MEGGVGASMLAQLKRLSDTNAAHGIATIAATVATRGTGSTNDHAIDASGSPKSIGHTNARNWSKSRGCWEKLPESGQLSSSARLPTPRFLGKKNRDGGPGG